MMSSPHEHDSDSENDPDFVPANVHESDSSSDERDAKRARTDEEREPELTAEQETAKKKEREALWAEFQTSAATPAKPDKAPKRMIKVEKRYRFAGEEVIEVKEVPEDSDEARKWPAWTPSEHAATPEASPLPAAASSSRAESSTSSPTPASESQARPAAKKPPGRRKPKVQLGDIPSSSSQKAKKLSTLEKSAMDWQAHVDAQKETGLTDELEAHKRGGGYLEKVQFLQRVGERRDEMLDASKDRKRRRG
ncbi:hypothetical protein EWM64_g2840 [Hericium alpestre]|uniref:SWR1-complex protein 5 n=1 Tax=Hericium alpestre TaxID=135208 RepID=A0A4Z0A5H0_9AGAM|nr:hypothetical protein EWM64_g2840 [Hericium alpestre]